MPIELRIPKEAVIEALQQQVFQPDATLKEIMQSLQDPQLAGFLDTIQWSAVEVPQVKSKAAGGTRRRWSAEEKEEFRKAVYEALKDGSKLRVVELKDMVPDWIDPAWNELKGSLEKDSSGGPANTVWFLKEKKGAKKS